jgi:hypothetical protein
MVKILGISKVLAGMLVLSVVCFSSIFPSCSVSTAKLTDVKVCSSLNNNVCESDVPSFAADVSAIHCTANLNNAPSKTKVTFEWKHEGVSIGKTEVEAESGYVSSTFTPGGTLEAGKFSVTVNLGIDNSTPITKEFTID